MFDDVVDDSIVGGVVRFGDGKYYVISLLVL